MFRALRKFLYLIHGKNERAITLFHFVTSLLFFFCILQLCTIVYTILFFRCFYGIREIEVSYGIYHCINYFGAVRSVRLISTLWSIFLLLITIQCTYNYHYVFKTHNNVRIGRTDRTAKKKVVK
jgi:hypothetical protein